MSAQVPERVGATARRSTTSATPAARTASAKTAPVTETASANPTSERAAEAQTAPTEARNPRTAGLDELSTDELLAVINAEDADVAGAVRAVLGDLAVVVDATVDRLHRGGRVHYFGAGTSGRIASMDAVELGPTFGLADGVFVAHHAGGAAAMGRPQEGAEDDSGLGAMAADGLGSDDVAIGVTASGRTAYVGGALGAARRAGAFTVLVSCNPGAPLADLADRHVAIRTGAEVIAGSTRLKAGTAEKMVLNAFSTAVMVRLGRTYENLMIEAAGSNEKLRARGLVILHDATGADADTCRRTLAACGGVVKVALVAILADTDPVRAHGAVDEASGNVRKALVALGRRAEKGASVH